MKELFIDNTKIIFLNECFSDFLEQNILINITQT